MSNKTYESREQLEMIYHTIKEQLEVNCSEVTITVNMAEFLLATFKAVLSGNDSFEIASGLTPKTGAPAIDPDCKRRRTAMLALKVYEILIHQRKAAPSYTIDQAFKKAASSSTCSYNQYKKAWSDTGGLRGIEVFVGLNEGITSGD